MGKPGCGGWLPIQALDHSDKVNVDGVESECWPASSASHPCPDPLSATLAMMLGKRHLRKDPFCLA